MFAVNLGTLISFIAGAFLSYRIVPCVMLVVPIIFVLSYIVFPEKSQYRVQRIFDTEEDIHIRLHQESVENNINASGNITFADFST